MNLLATLVELFGAILLEAIKAGDDRDKQQAVLMSAEERIYQARVEQKYGSK